MGRAGQGLLCVAAPPVGRHRQDVAVEVAHRVLGAGQNGRLRVGDGLQRLIGDVDEGGGPPGRFPVLGHHQGHDVAQVGGAAPGADEHGPVLVDEPDHRVAGHVGRGEHPHHAGGGGGPAGVDGDHVGPGVVGQADRSVQQARDLHVVDEELVAQGEFAGLVAGRPGPDAPDGLQRRPGQPVGPGGQHLHRVEDLEVAGAAAQVGPQVAGGLLPGEVGAVPVDQGLGPHDDAGDAEPALHRPGRPEGGGEALPLVAREPLGGDHRGPGRLLQRDLAGHPGLAVDQHCAGPALPRRRAAVLGRHQIQLLAQRGQQMGVLPDAHCRPVADKLGDAGAMPHPEQVRPASGRLEPERLSRSGGSAPVLAVAPSGRRVLSRARFCRGAAKPCPRATPRPGAPAMSRRCSPSPRWIFNPHQVPAGSTTW